MNNWTWIGDDFKPHLRTQGRDTALDTETTGLDYQDEVLGFAIAWRNSRGKMKSTYFRAPYGQMSIFDRNIIRGEADVEQIIEDLYHQHHMVYHNEPFDHRAMYRALGESPHPFPTKQTHDTQHLATLLAWQESRTLRHLYDKYVRKPLPKGYSDMKGKRGKLKDMPLDQVALYGRTDAENTLELKEMLYPRVYRALPDLYDFEREYALLVMKMIRRGLKLDFRWCQVKESEFRGRMVEIERQLYKIGHLTDVGSNPKVAVLLFQTLELDPASAPPTSLKRSGFPRGLVPSVASEVLEKYEDQHEAVGLVLEWRQLKKALGSWVRGYRNHAQIDGYIHSSLNPFGTVSARIAASKPNVTAIPMEDRGQAFGSMMGMFVGDTGETLWAVDYSQMETRLAAAMAREGNLMQVLNSGRDPYIEMAKDMFDNPDERNDAKRGTLASIYGVGVDKFAETWNMEYDRARYILHTFRNRYPRIQQISNLAESLAESDGCVRAYTGRPRWFGPGENKYKAFNQKVQMTVAEILKRAMLCCFIPS
jgi:DNA polymerase-1